MDDPRITAISNGFTASPPLAWHAFVRIKVSVETSSNILSVGAISLRPFSAGPAPSSMYGCIWTPPDCNSFDCSGSWSQLLTYIRLHNAA